MGETAIGELLLNQREFLAFLERRVGDRATAEDLLQEAFVRGMAHAGEIRSEESVRAWFYRLLRNAVIDHHRRSGAAGRALDAFARELDKAVEPELADAVCACVRRLAEGLKPEYAEAIRRVELDGLPVKEWAREAGITPNHAGVRLHRAREALRRQVRSRCGGCADAGCVDCTCSDPR